MDLTQVCRRYKIPPRGDADYGLRRDDGSELDASFDLPRCRAADNDDVLIGVAGCGPPILRDAFVTFFTDAQCQSCADTEGVTPPHGPSV